MRNKSTLFYKPKNQNPPKAKRKWIILPYLWRAVKYTCMSIGAMILLSLIIGFFLTSAILKDTESAIALPQEMILFYKLEGSIAEGPPLSGFEAFGPKKLSLNEIIHSLEKATYDNRVKAFIVSVRRSELALSQIQELRQAISEFKEKSGKPAYIYSMSYMEAGQGLALYSLASVFDEIWLSPMGGISINGLYIEQPYLRNMLDKLGIEPLFLQREEYKGVFENFTEDEMSDPSRESYEALTKSFVKEFLKDVIAGRPRLAEEQNLPSMINKGFFLDEDALQLGLIDRVEYGDILLSELREKLGGKADDKTPELIRLSHYHTSTKKKDALSTPKDNIAVIYVQGPIMVFSENEDGKSLIGETSESADQIASLIIRAAEDDNIESIVLRVDSPGGSPTASELIRRAVLRAQEEEKQVIVSMGSMAASGGYWVSAPADRIFASPNTITGSIGVAGGKINMREFWNNIDVNWDSVSVGKNSGMYSINKDFSEAERDIVEASMDHIYNKFLSVVAEGRNMEPEAVREVAKGRVWSGAQAFEVGLVDEMGGLNEALDYAAKQSGHRDRRDVNVIILPEPKTPLEEVMQLLKQTASLPLFMQKNAAMLNAVLSEEQQQKVLQDMSVIKNGNGVYVYEPMENLR